MPVASHSRKLEKEEEGGGGVASQKDLGRICGARPSFWLLGGGGRQT
jgi:hypothetical protein